MTDMLSWIRNPGPFLIGHRGFPGAARENTPRSFEAALEAGCDGVEFDVRMTRDGVLVVHHDEAAAGPGGPLRLAETDWTRLAGERLAGPDGPYRLSALDEILGMLGGRCLLNLEMKPPGPGQHDDAADLLLGALEGLRPRESMLISSFDPEMLAAIRRRDGSALLGYLFTSLAEYNHLEEEEVSESVQALHPHHGLVDPKFMKRAEERGLPVVAWTVDDPTEAIRLVELGASAIITNRPDLVGDGLLGDLAED
jgi:glycerophosphoryl diester phosphodiesterase